PPELPPLEEKFSVLIEYLDTVVAAIRDEQPSFGIHCEIVRHIKFAWTPSLLAPFLDELSVLVELHDSIVAFGTAVAVGDEYVAIGRDQDIGWLAEHVWRISGDPRFTERHQDLAILIEFHDRVALAVVHGAPVADPDIVVFVDQKPMRVVEHSAAKALHQLAAGIELHDRVESRLRAIGRRLAAVEGPVALAIAVHVEADHGAEFAPIGKLSPAIREVVDV